MTIVSRFRAPLIGLVALVFSAGIAFAGQPTSTGLANASTHAGKTVPVQASDVQAGSEDTDTTETTTTETTETTDSTSTDHCNVDLTQDPSVLAGLNHGSVVCTAAQADTPQGFANHGAYVSSFAKGDHGTNNQSATGKSHQPGN